MGSGREGEVGVLPPSSLKLALSHEPQDEQEGAADRRCAQPGESSSPPGRTGLRRPRQEDSRRAGGAGAWGTAAAPVRPLGSPLRREELRAHRRRTYPDTSKITDRRAASLVTSLVQGAPASKQVALGVLVATATDSDNAARLTEAGALHTLFHMLRQEERGSALHSQVVAAANALMGWMQKELEADASCQKLHKELWNTATASGLPAFLV